MGIFDKFKKKKSEDTAVNEEKADKKIETKEEQSEKSSKENSKESTEALNEENSKTEETKAELPKGNGLPSSSVTTDSERFTLVVEDTVQLQNNNGITVVGFIHGEIKVTDVVYVLQASGKITLSTVEGIETEEKNTLNTAKDQRVNIRLSQFKNKDDVSKLSVLTNIRPQTVVDISTAVQNPQLFGLLYEYPNMRNDPAYFNLLIFSLCHSNFLVPMFTEKEPISSDNGIAKFEKNTKIGFPSLKHPQNENITVFPMFTDWESLRRWKNIFDKNHMPKAMILTFPDAVEIAKTGGGIVVNPFGPMSLFLSSEMINKIKSIPGYRNDFVKKENKAQFKQMKVEKNTPIMIAVPGDTPELKLIKESIATYAKHCPDIKRVDLLLKAENDKTKLTYLCIVDCPNGKEPQIFEEIFNAVKAYMNNIKTMDFTTYEKSTFAHKYLDDKTKAFAVE